MRLDALSVTEQADYLPSEETSQHKEDKMHFVTRSQMQAAKVDDTTVVAEASTIGLPVGVWPDFIAVMNDEDRSKGGMLRRSSSPNEDGGYTYTHGTGAKIVVLND